MYIYETSKNIYIYRRIKNFMKKTNVMIVQSEVKAL